MVLKMIKGGAVVSAFVALSSFAMGASGCGEEDKTDDKADPGGDADGGGASGTYDASFTLISVADSDDSNPIVAPHKVVVLDAATGKPLDPPIETTTKAGKFTLKGIPKDTTVSIYVQGVGPAGDDAPGSTYDTILLNFNPKAGDPLFRISTAGLLALAPGSADYEVKADRAAAAGAIYWAPSPAGTRKGSVGCAKICIDGKTPAEDLDVRYIAPNSTLPTTIDRQSETSRSGRFYVGNLTEGKHTLAASLDNCKTTLGDETEFFVPFSRGEAKSEVKAVLLQLFIDLDVASNPTPKSCPTP